MAMRHGGGEERRNVSRSAVESGEAVCETKRRQPLPEGAFHRAGSAAVSTAENVPLNRADERPLIAVSAGNFNTAKTFCWLSLWNFKEKNINHFL